jgi:hypothetical protein
VAVVGLGFCALVRDDTDVVSAEGIAPDVAGDTGLRTIGTVGVNTRGGLTVIVGDLSTFVRDDTDVVEWCGFTPDIPILAEGVRCCV